MIRRILRIPLDIFMKLLNTHRRRPNDEDNADDDKDKEGEDKD